MTRPIGRGELEELRHWADDKLARADRGTGEWFQYMHLCEALDAVLSGLDARPTADGSLQTSGVRAGLRLVADNTREG